MTAALTLVHGWGLGSAIWQPLLTNLGVPYRLLDLPGYGIDAGNLAWSVDNISQWMHDQLLPGSHVLAWSMGGMLALRLASEYPRLFSRLTLVATTPRFVAANDWIFGATAVDMRRFDALLQRSYPFFVRRFISMLGIGDMQLRRQLADQVLLEKQITMNVLKGSLRLLLELDLRPRLDQISIPVTVIHGDVDRIIPVGSADFLVEALPNGCLHRVKRAGHAVFLSHQAEFLAILAGDRHAG